MEEKMKKIQFIAEPNVCLIDKNADEYILSRQILYRVENRHLLDGKYRALFDLPTEEEYLERRQYVLDLCDRLISYYGKKASTQYSISLSDEQWWILLGKWLECLLIDAYGCYQQVVGLKDIEGIFLAKEGDNVRKVYDNRAKMLKEERYSERFRSVFYAWFFERFGLKVETVLTEDSLIDARSLYNDTLKKGFFWRGRLMRAAKDPTRIIRRIKWLRKQNYLKQTKQDIESVVPVPGEIFVSGSRMPPEMERKIADKGNGRITFASDAYYKKTGLEIISACKENREERKRFFAGFPAKSPFEELVSPLLRDFITVSYFEAIPRLIERARLETASWSCRKIYHSEDNREFFLTCCALMKEKGCIICDIQHSATYGNVFTQGFGEYRACDRFLSWGWKLENQHYGNIRAVAMSRVPSEPQMRDIHIKEKILLITNTPELSEMTIGWSHQDYIDREMDFVDSLSEENRKKLVIRLLPASLDHSDLRARCHEKYPYIRFEMTTEKPFEDSLLESELLVCDYYGSSHIEALMMGKPFVMFDGAKILAQNPGIQMLLDQLRKTGIYTRDGSECAKQINAHKDWNAWLLSVENKQMLETYKQEMTGGEDKADLWFQEFIGD